jgi:hypothetical protein
MLSLQDCLDFTELSEETIAIIVERENVPAVVAIEIGETLLATRQGVRVIGSYLLDGIERAQRARKTERALRLRRAYDELIRRHAAND